MKRAPAALGAALGELPGVAEVQTGVEALVRVEVPGSDDPVIGQLVGLDLRAPPRLNRVSLTAGQPLEPLQRGTAGDGAIPALVSEGFASARGLKFGDTLGALVNGRQRRLRVVGTAVSPEHVFAGLWGTPDQRGYGIFWVDREVLEAAFDLRGAFNRVSLRLAPGASEPAVMAALQQRLAAYGGRDVIPRAEQASHAMLEGEIKSQRVVGTVLPAIFLAVAAFLLNVVVSRLVGTQREQIAALKALGYANAAIALHYLQLVLLIVALGLALGAALGQWLGAQLTALYAEFYRFPRLEHRLAPGLLGLAGGVTAATAVLGTLGAIAATVRLAPAEAMRAPAPARYRPTLLERLGVQRLPSALRMVLRNMERRPLRTLLCVGGIAAALAITVLGNFLRDAMDEIVYTQFTLSLRGDVTLWMDDVVDDAVRLELARLPGVLGVESTRFVPVNLIRGARHERSLIRGYAPRPELYRVMDAQGHAVPLEERGLVLTDRLADKLGVRAGDTVEAEVLVGRPRRLRLAVGATVRESMGLNAYMDRRQLNRLLGDGDVATGFVLSVQRGGEAALLRATRHIPRLAGAFSKATLLRNMQEVSARNVRIMSTVLTAFAVVIAVGVVYNNARIALAERGWELASLRVLGFTSAEVSWLLLGELALCIAVALPLGMLLGYGLTHGVAQALKSDQFFFPVVIRARTYAWAALVVVAAGAASALVVRRRVDRLDLVAVLKTRD
ncbi:ABC transporter permease [Azohydromonas lata]|uniref:FtsX-like permease family protein n=1 Tax=Azohydromonas lata TaxID=45677 RepID=A0ABU5IR86_9BURK|nr:FtsX-like permease family protein [Azohydromonas lata]MDZ5461411.1 FtsX-like permease family protein [Azohydromonas lata]